MPVSNVFNWFSWRHKVHILYICSTQGITDLFGIQDYMVYVNCSIFWYTSESLSDDKNSTTSVMDTNVDSYYNHREHDTGSDDDLPVVDQLPVNTDDVIDPDDVEEDTISMDVLSVDERETVVVKQSVRLKQKLMHMVSVMQVLLSLLT